MSNTLPKIILFDDDPENLRLYSQLFGEHFQVKVSQTPLRFPEILTHDTDAILIDVLMPVMNGIELYKEILKHPSYNGCPLIFITSSRADEVMIEALSAGGNDFLSRSMKKQELILRVSSKIDFFHRNRTVFCLGNLKIDMLAPTAMLRNQVLHLTLIEMKILKTLIRYYPGACEREVINQETCPGMVVQSATLNTHISNLRQKISDWEYEIRIIKNLGVQLVPR